ncbi:MAG: winged helix-turn-helix transcriptional regulator [ANME-2 cluster archaeon]|nr:winged helix-turn-helix transcriptional regulator [ANME-2 cluster archaeon]MBC2701199.1 winged helix-turn-helix transcriptional regulator [ANME-2 cluster archaeon]MBC2707138.1 winged helix-turn-helix transcriptional regulator [ANME-2 cluster archaeon]MBC2747562.1 winged helix-turn-helix transcriptional regulator [ANME-2 cluster archaeon]
MALEDFLGDTSELKIIDFLAENMDNSYNQTEISEFTGLSRTTVNKKIPEMIHNHTIEIIEELGNLKTYQLADNEIVKMLVSASLAHSFKQAENPLGEEESKDTIRRMMGSSSFSELNRFYVEPICDFIIMSVDQGKIIRMKPAKRTTSPILVSA